jgi:pyruvate dehydrogenase E2 component (dihydrolipoamide acetyltransferase)
MQTVIMPKFGFTQETAELVRWIKQTGQAVEQGEPIAEVTTDKINMEVEAPASGILAGLMVKVGELVPVTAVIAYILAPGESFPSGELLPSGEDQSQPPSRLAPEPAPTPSLVTPLAARVAAEQGLDASHIPGSGPGGRVTRRDVETYLAGQGPLRATPAARRVARELGMGLARVPGSGPRGRIQGSDVLAAHAAAAAPAAPALPAAPPAGEVKKIPLAGMRRTIARRMQQSAQEAPHITLQADIQAGALEALCVRANEGLKASQSKVGPTAVIARAVAWALQQHPALNSRLEGEDILLLPGIHLGIAVALEEGLIVPVVRDVPHKGIRQLAAEIAELSERARRGALRPDDVAEGTFTLSNLGMFGVDRFTAIINPPQAAILAIGRISKHVVPDEADQPVVRPLMTVTLSADHRIVDGAVAARFLADLRVGLEHPETLTL